MNVCTRKMMMTKFNARKGVIYEGKYNLYFLRPRIIIIVTVYFTATNLGRCSISIPLTTFCITVMHRQFSCHFVLEIRYHLSYYPKYLSFSFIFPLSILPNYFPFCQGDINKSQYAKLKCHARYARNVITIL